MLSTNALSSLHIALVSNNIKQALHFDFHHFTLCLFNANRMLTQRMFFFFFLA